MNTKYVFLDIDGTLVAADGVIPDSAREAIGKARAAGHKVFICSGRSRCEMHEDIMSVSFDGIVGSAGAYVELEGKMIYHRPMTEAMNRRLLDYFLGKNMAVLLETNDDLLVNDIGLEYIRRHIEECNARGEPYDKALFDLASPLSAVKEPYKLPVNKLLYVTKEHEPEQIKQDLQAEFTVVDSAIRLPGRSGELSESGMDKGNGIRILISHFGADRKDTIGIGDGENDIQMLRETGFGVAMGNGNPKLKEIADYVTTDVDKDGLYNAFLHCGLFQA